MSRPVTRSTLVIAVLVLAGCAVGAASGEEVRPKADHPELGEVRQEGKSEIRAVGVATFGLG